MLDIAPYNRFSAGHITRSCYGFSTGYSTKSCMDLELDTALEVSMMKCQIYDTRPDVVMGFVLGTEPEREIGLVKMQCQKLKWI